MQNVTTNIQHNLNLIFYNKDQEFIAEPAQITPKIIKHQRILTQQRRNMLFKYRAYVEAYRKQIERLNMEVVKYNANVIAFTEQNSLQDTATKNNKSLSKKINKISVTCYNQAVEQLNNNTKEPLLLKQKHKPVPKSHEHTFAIILFKYAMQIEAKNKTLQQAGATTTRALETVTINHYELANTQINDVLTLPYCKRTMHNHVNRLVEAGVLFSYEFHGSKKGVSYHINPQILEVFDQKTSKTLNTENQFFTYAKMQNFHNNEIVTRAFINKININDNVNKHSRKRTKEATPLSQLLGFKKPIQDANNKNTKRANVEKSLTTKQETIAPGAQKINQRSTFLLAQLQDVNDLCVDLQDQKHKKHRFLLKDHLEKEALTGNLTRHEFRELLIQEFLKLAAPIWKNTTPYAASWRKTYNFLNEKALKTANNNIPSKANLLYLFESLLWRITYAKRFFNRFPTYNVPFPGDYFNPDKNTNSFKYTHKFYLDHKKRETIKAEKAKADRAKALKSNQRYKATQLLYKQVKKLKNGTINMSQLHDYATQNSHIPSDLVHQIPKIIENVYKA